MEAKAPHKEKPVLATLPLRFAARFVDGFLVGSAVLILVRGWLGNPSSDLIPIGFAALGFLYHALLESDLGGGRTLGKRLLQIRVVNRKGKPPSLFRSMLRSSVFLLMPILGPVAHLIDLTGLPFNFRYRRLWHDVIGGTYVLRQPQAEAAGRLLWRALRIPLALVLLIAVSILYPRFAQHRDGSPSRAITSTQEATSR